MFFHSAWGIKTNREAFIRLQIHMCTCIFCDTFSWGHQNSGQPLSFTVLGRELQDFLSAFRITEDLKLSIQKTKIMASGPITSWQIDWEKMETVIGLTFLGSQITADNDCNHEIKRRLLLGRKGMINLDDILKSRDITLLTKVCRIKAMIFH